MKRYFFIGFLILVIVSILSYYSYKFLDGKSGPEAPLESLTALPVEPEKPVPPEFVFVKLPETVKASQEFEVIWEVKAPNTKAYLRAGLYFDQSPHPTNFKIETYSNHGKLHQGTIPERFSDKLTAPASGNIYLRANILLDGTDFWTEERIIKLSK